VYFAVSRHDLLVDASERASSEHFAQLLQDVKHTRISVSLNIFKLVELRIALQLGACFVLTACLLT
jgi:hypothetical protein